MSEPTEPRIDDAASPPIVPSAWTIEHAVSAWQQMQAELADDEDLLADENVIAVALRKADATDPRACLSALIDATTWAQRREDEARAVAREMEARARRYKDRQDYFRVLIDGLMHAIGVRRAVGKFARAGRVRSPPSVLPTDEQLIPDQYWRTERKLLRLELLEDLKAGVVVDGAVLSNGGETLRIEKLR